MSNSYQQITFLEDELDRLLHHSRILKKERIAIGKLIEFALIGAELRESLSSAIDLSLDYHSCSYRILYNSDKIFLKDGGSLNLLSCFKPCPT